MTETSKKEIYTYEAPFVAYAMAWNRSPTSHKFRMAVSSYKEEYSNQIHIIQRDEVTSAHAGNNLVKISEFEHPYPATKLMWAPPSINSSHDLMATTGDYLRLGGIDSDNGSVFSTNVLNNNKHTEYCAPLTSFDWNETEPSMIGTCSIDTTCTIWDVNRMTPKTQLMAHDKEVYDIAFASGKDVFGTVGADGSLRMFDLRSLEHSTILYESPDLSPLLRISWNKEEPNYIATIMTDSPKAIILDIRVPSLPLAELVGHEAAVNSVTWAPNSAFHICTCSDDKQAFIWDITVKPKPIEDPILAFSAGGSINSLEWCPSHVDWVSICYDNFVQILKV